MSTIDPSSLLLAHIRAQALAWSRSRRSSQSTSGRKGDAGTSGVSADWSSQVLGAIRQIPREDPDRPRKAFRVFLQAAIARDLGFTRLDSGDFIALVDRVQEAMEADPGLRDAIARASAHLLDEAR